MAQIVRTKGKKPNGKSETIITLVLDNGTRVRLFNPDQRGRKYASELKSGHDFFTKKPLKNTQKSFRSGYLKSRSDSAKAWKAKKAKRAAKKNKS